MSKKQLTLALPKGRLTDPVQDLLAQAGIAITFEDRKLVANAEDSHSEIDIRALLVKNADLPVYVHHAIAGLGVCGEDVIYESGYDLVKLFCLPVGASRMCLAGFQQAAHTQLEGADLSIATKFPRFTRGHFHRRGIPVEIIKLSGSVELAPVLGLCPFIVDIVETGKTLKAHDLVVLEELTEISVHLVANPAYYKLHYREIDRLVQRLEAACDTGGRS